MINVELTETDYRRIINALSSVNSDPCLDYVGDLIESLKKSHDRFVRAKELGSAKFLAQQAYNKCKDVANSADFMPFAERDSLKEAINSLQSAMSKIDQTILFQKQGTTVINGGNICTDTVNIA